MDALDRRPDRRRIRRRLITGVYYAVGDGNTSLWSYAGGTWTEVARQYAVDPVGGGRSLQSE